MRLLAHLHSQLLLPHQAVSQVKRYLRLVHPTTSAAQLGPVHASTHSVLPFARCVSISHILSCVWPMKILTRPLNRMLHPVCRPFWNILSCKPQNHAKSLRTSKKTTTTSTRVNSRTLFHFPRMARLPLAYLALIPSSSPVRRLP